MFLVFIRCFQLFKQLLRLLIQFNCFMGKSYSIFDSLNNQKQKKMKTKIITIAFLLLVSATSIKASNGGEEKNINKNRVEIIKDFIKTEVLKEKPSFSSNSKEQILAFEARIVEDGTIKVENINCSNPNQGILVRNKLESIIIYNPEDVVGSVFTMKFKFIQK